MQLEKSIEDSLGIRDGRLSMAITERFPERYTGSDQVVRIGGRGEFGLDASQLISTIRSGLAESRTQVSLYSESNKTQLKKISN
jgi:hypothetical protein